jgi:hypothetical protein
MSDLPNLTPLHAALQTWRDACKQRRAQERTTEQIVTTLLAGYVGEDAYQRVKLLADAEHALSGLDWRRSTGADSHPIQGLFAALYQIEHLDKPAGPLAARIAAAEAKTEATKRGVPVAQIVEAARLPDSEVQSAEIRSELQRQGISPAWDRQGPVQ